MSEPIRKENSYRIFSQMKTEDLEELLRLDYRAATEDDTEHVLQILDVLAKREQKRDPDSSMKTEIALQSFKDNYLPFADDAESLYDWDMEGFNDDIDKREQPELMPSAREQPIRLTRRHRTIVRLAFSAAIIIVILFVAPLTASAFGVNLWETFAQWTQDTFGFSLSNNPRNSENDEHSVIDGQFTSLQSALQFYNIEDELVPNWFPNNYKLSSIDVVETPKLVTFTAIYNDTDNELIIRIALVLDDYRNIYEKDNTEIEIYAKNSTEHFLIVNNGLLNALWSVSNLECSISGYISVNEAKKMIDSIYER